MKTVEDAFLLSERYFKIHPAGLWRKHVTYLRIAN